MTTEKNFGESLQSETVAVRLSKNKFGVSRTLNESQTAQAAATFHASKKVLRSRKTLLDARHPAYRKVTGIMTAAGNYWRACSVPYPENGIRLMNRDSIESFEAAMESLQSSLTEAASELDTVYSELRQKAAEDLGDLFNASDYPESIGESFAFSWEYPSVAPPDYLRDLNPKLYERESARVSARFDEAVQMAEQMFLVELGKLVSRLQDRLSPAKEGEKKILQGRLVEGFDEFFDRFKQLSIGSNRDLTETVELCESLMHGVDVKMLRNSGQLRSKIGEGLGGLKDMLDTMIVDAPARAFDFEEE